MSDTILIADFDNKTGDASFDGTLKQALALQLEQSPFLNIFPDERVSQALRFMKRAPDERVTREVAKESCQRQGLKAMLVGLSGWPGTLSRFCFELLLDRGSVLPESLGIISQGSAPLSIEGRAGLCQ